MNRKMRSILNRSQSKHRYERPIMPLFYFDYKYEDFKDKYKVVDYKRVFSEIDPYGEEHWEEED